MFYFIVNNYKWCVSMLKWCVSMFKWCVSMFKFKVVSMYALQGRTCCDTEQLNVIIVIF